MIDSVKGNLRLNGGHLLTHSTVNTTMENLILQTRTIFGEALSSFHPCRHQKTYKAVFVMKQFSRFHCAINSVVCC